MPKLIILQYIKAYFIYKHILYIVEQVNNQFFFYYYSN
jgi:hypothetical protein